MSEQQNKKDKKGISAIQIVFLAFCISGCGLMAVGAFVEKGPDLFPIALVLNGIGIAFFLYSMKSKPVE